MIAHPNCKINIGLHVTERRPDGYHNLETIFAPIPLCDTLEITPAPEFSFHQHGLRMECDTSENLCVRAYRLLKEVFPAMGAVSMTLTKEIPMGAGMGGGSSDAAFTLKMLNELFALGLGHSQMESLATRLGADCPFFVRNVPAFATGIGNVLSPIDLSMLDGWHLVLAKPAESVSTAEAYRGIVPRSGWARRPSIDLREAIRQPVATWKESVVNDFERSVFPRHPAIARCKDELYRAGAAYASMTGSGAAVYGLFPPGEDFWSHIEKSSYLCKIDTLTSKVFHYGRL